MDGEQPLSYRRPNARLLFGGPSERRTVTLPREE